MEPRFRQAVNGSFTPTGQRTARQTRVRGQHVIQSDRVAITFAPSAFMEDVPSAHRPFFEENTKQVPRMHVDLVGELWKDCERPEYERLNIARFS